MHPNTGGEIYRAGRPALGARLLAAAGMVAGGRVVADVGCDHGKLAVYLAKRGDVPRVVAIDSRPLPLARAKALVAQTGCAGKVDCRLGSGLAPLLPGKAQEIVIAGLSAETMAQILEEAAWVQDAAVHLVLVPASRHAWLRRWLCQSGFAIEKEMPVLENGRSYTVISARYSGSALQPDELFCQIGKITPDGSDAANAYFRARLRALAGAAKAPMAPAEKKAHQQLMEEIAACLQ